MSVLLKKILFITALCLSVLVLTLTANNNSSIETTKNTYLLKAYKNTVALYKDEEIITIYENVILNTLPENDIQNFNKGIEVSTPAQAETLLEDYDG